MPTQSPRPPARRAPTGRRGWFVAFVALAAAAAGAASMADRGPSPTTEALTPAVGINAAVGPIGSVDRVRPVADGVEVTGWAARTSGEGARPYVEITAAGDLLARFRPDQTRFDLDAAYGDRTRRLGFGTVVVPPPNTAAVCADAVYGSSGARVRLGCGRADPDAAAAEAAGLDDLLHDLGRAAESELDDITVGLSVIPFDTGELAGWREDRLFISASAAKSWWTAAALANGQAEAAAQFAGPVFEESSDRAAGSMIDLAGGIDAVNDFTLSVGMTDTAAIKWHHGGRRESEQSPGPLNGSNHVDAGDAALFFYELGTYQVLTPDLTELLAEWMRRSPRDVADRSEDPEASTISDSLPTDVKALVEQKAGWLRPGEYSVPAHLLAVGIVRPTNGQAPFAIAMMSVGGDRPVFSRVIDFFQSASCQIYVHQSHDISWPCPTW